MMAFPGMLIGAAKEAGMKAPKDPDNFDRDKYPHFFVFCKVQLCRPMQFGEHFENARLIASIDDDNIRRMTLTQLLALGLRYQQ